MCSLGLILVLVGSLLLVTSHGLGIKIDGWPAIFIGAFGIVYCHLATPSLSLLLVYAVSLVFLLYGTVALAVRCCCSVLRKHE